MAPGYPLFVVAIFCVFGTYTKASAAAIMLIQTGFAAATVLLLMRLTHRVFGTAAANLAGLVWAASPALVFFPIIFWETSLSTLLIAALVTLALYVSEAPTLARWLSLGACALFALAINPSLLSILFACFLWPTWRTRAWLNPRLWTTLLLCTLLFSAWPIRNYRVLHSFIPLRTNAGYELWQGNRPESNGFFNRDLHPNRDHIQFLQYQQLGELGYMQQKGELGKAAIAANKPRFLRLTVRRFIAFWTGSGPDSVFLMVLYAAVSSILGFAGLITLFKRSVPIALLFYGPILLFPLPYYITHPDFRFRSDIIPSWSRSLPSPSSPGLNETRSNATSSNEKAAPEISAAHKHPIFCRSAPSSVYSSKTNWSPIFKPFALISPAASSTAVFIFILTDVIANGFRRSHILITLRSLSSPITSILKSMPNI